MANIRGYALKPGEKVYLEFVPVEQCPIVGGYVLRTMKKLEIRDSEGNLVLDLLKE